MEAILVETTPSDRKLARAVKRKVTEATVELAKNTADTIALKIDGYKEAIDIPRSAIFLFYSILDNMAAGNSIALILSDSKAHISTQQAADLLGVSRRHMVHLLDKGGIPFFKVDTRRKIYIKDLIAYDKKMKTTMADKLDLLAAQAQELSMGY